MVTLTGVRSDSANVSTSVPQAASRPDDLSDNAHRQLIGYIGLVLPFLLILIVVTRDGIERWRSLESISAYYYTGAVAAFVGMLVALALFLFTYRGYDNKYNRADRWASKTAAVASIVIAFFPTKEPVGVSALSWWTPTTGILHHVAAIVLFAMFAIFALWLFRLTADGEQPVADKRRRNNFYLSCGIVIVVCIGWAGFNGLNGRPIFWPESIALIAFAMSWLIKGYALNTMVDAARSLLRS
jgi:heme A synthase